jgi:hypothetical protein
MSKYYVTATYIRDAQAKKALIAAESFANSILGKIERLVTEEHNHGVRTYLVRNPNQFDAVVVQKCMELLQKNDFECEIKIDETTLCETLAVSW